MVIRAGFAYDFVGRELAPSRDGAVAGDLRH